MEIMQGKKEYGDMINKFQRDIESAVYSVSIVSGEAVCQLYNTEPVRQSLFDAQKRGVKLRIIAGPLICIEEDSNTLLDLMGKKDVDLYRRKGRALVHYRVMDHKRIYIEKPHPAGVDLSKREPIPIKQEEQEFWAKNLEKEFDYQVEKKIAERVNSKNDFVLLRKSEIEGVKKKAEAVGKSFDFLTKEELSDLI